MMLLPTVAGRRNGYRRRPSGKKPPGAKMAGSIRGATVLSGRRANYCDVQCANDWKDTAENDGYAYTAPVGSYGDGVSPYGIHDLAGNVGEWVQD